MAAITTTPALEVSKICVLIPINIVPIKDAPFPNISKIPKYSDDFSFGMIFAFLPMLAKFNDKIGQIAKFTYGHQISMFVEKMDGISWEGVLITAVNFIVLIAVFVVVFRRNRLDS